MSEFLNLKVEIFQMLKFSNFSGTQRRTSITEMFFGNRPAMIRQTSTTSETDSIGTPERSLSITEVNSLVL